MKRTRGGIDMYRPSLRSEENFSACVEVIWQHEAVRGDQSNEDRESYVGVGDEDHVRDTATRKYEASGNL